MHARAAARPLSIVRCLVQASFVAEMNMRELAVGILQVERDRADDLAGAAADLGQPNSKLCGKSIRTRCSAPVTGLRIGSPVKAPRPEHRAGAARVDVDVEGDRMEQGRVLGRAHCAEHPPHRGHVLGFLSR